MHSCSSSAPLASLCKLVATLPQGSAASASPSSVSNVPAAGHREELRGAAPCPGFPAAAVPRRRGCRCLPPRPSSCCQSCLEARRAAAGPQAAPLLDDHLPAHLVPMPHLMRQHTSLFTLAEDFTEALKRSTFIRICGHAAPCSTHRIGYRIGARCLS